MTITGSITLGYIGFHGDPAKWKPFCEQVFGLQSVPTEDGIRFRTDERQWRIGVTPGEVDGLDYVGLEIQSNAQLDHITQKLRDAGILVTEDKTLASVRQVGRLVTTTAPDGTKLELFTGAQISCTPFASPTGARFVTGDIGLGHILVLVPDIDEALTFYVDVLGLRRSDVVAMGPGIDAHFLGSGKRHHVVALCSLPDLSGLDHLFIEVDSIETVGIAWDKVLAGAAPVGRSLGQHANDPVVSFYAESPSGFLMEYGCGSTIIDNPDTWIESRWESAYLWGGTFGSRAVR